MFTLSKSNKPADTIRDGSIKATIWKVAGEDGGFYTVNITRTYKDSDGAYRDSDSFSGTEPLRVARLAQKAYDRMVELHQQERRESTPAS